MGGCIYGKANPLDIAGFLVYTVHSWGSWAMNTATILWIIGIIAFAIYCWSGGLLAGLAVASGSLDHRMASFRFRTLFLLATMLWPVLLLANAVEEWQHRRKGEPIG